MVNNKIEDVMDMSIMSSTYMIYNSISNKVLTKDNNWIPYHSDKVILGNKETEFFDKNSLRNVFRVGYDEAMAKLYDTGLCNEESVCLLEVNAVEYAGMRIERFEKD